MEPYDVFLVVLGLSVLGAAVLPRVLHRGPLSLPTVHIVAGIVLWLLVDELPSPDPDGESAVAERLSEIVVIVSLTATGLKIDRPMGWKRWNPTWRLLAVAMPLTIGATAVVGWAALGLVPASAVLLGAVLAPTDPVLASEVQVTSPNAGDEDEARLALTSEAGLNDSLAFPFTNLAIALAAGGAWFGGWVLDDVVLKLASGLIVGFACGHALAWLAFRSPPRANLARTTEGFAALGATFAVYGVAELLHGYGFLSVFVAAVVLRGHEREHEYHLVLHDATRTVEELGSALLLLLVGGAVAEGGLSELGVAEVAVAVAVVAVIRPLAGWLCLVGSRLNRTERWVVAAFGIRGMGSVYYLAYAADTGSFEDTSRLWSIVLLVILLSVAVHGATAARAVERVANTDEAEGPAPAEPSAR